jgi:class 3 adenylate cyclase
MAEARTYSDTTRSIGGRAVSKLVQPLQGPKTFIDFNTSELEALFGKNPLAFAQASIGPHPDFAGQINAGEFCYHHCVSMFVDIKGSTRLSTKYSPLEIRRIKDTVLTACIHVASFFGGHVHRLQGDAAFMQFVRAGHNPSDSIINALNAASVLALFVSQTLAEVFENNGVRPLTIRIGIDYGTDEDVIWSHYGIPECSELTTTSFHTDLAAKLQQRAGTNEVRIGGNVRATLDLPDEFWSYVKDSAGNKEYYVFDYDGKRYNQYIFDWRKFLLSYDFARLNADGKTIDVDTDPNRLHIRCEANDNGRLIHYRPNSLALPKGLSLTYKLYYGNTWYTPQNWEVVQWRRTNRGEEAKNARALEQMYQTGKGPQAHFNTSTAYLGHHYMECKISSQHGHIPTQQLKFPIFIR